MKDNIKRSAETEIPAQSYVDDILPRYKEALSLGVTSGKNYLQARKSHPHSTTSFFRTGAAHGSLPHIIGSEEYIHDNSCGLAENFALGSSPYDPSYISEPNGVSSEAHCDLPDLFSINTFETQEGPSEKDKNEPLVSAASEFKAMLEAALLSPYKFEDEVDLSVHDVATDCRSTEQTRNSVDFSRPRSPPQAVQFSSSDFPNITEEKRIPVHDENLTSVQDSDVHAHKLFSSLVSRSLFDSEEDSFSSNQVDDADLPASAETSTFRPTEIFDDNDFVQSTHFESSPDIAGSSSHKGQEYAGGETANTSLLREQKFNADASGTRRHRLQE